MLFGTLWELTRGFARFEVSLARMQRLSGTSKFNPCGGTRVALLSLQPSLLGLQVFECGNPTLMHHWHFKWCQKGVVVDRVIFQLLSRTLREYSQRVHLSTFPLILSFLLKSEVVFPCIAQWQRV
uniref:Uncharacterized protein n=1 Tax=Trypanosoma congolense (strain IL3000) TaxID=1068625 RepID=G0V258_TRYCI|nr:hypothetical protein, unlikely [Trypanosoma congolense IL3000]